MIYKIYKESSKGYEAVCSTNDIDELFIVLDILILEEENDKVLVIRHDIKDNYDEPIYLYIGDIIGYLKYKDEFYYKELGISLDGAESIEESMAGSLYRKG